MEVTVKLTVKDKEFLERLRELIQNRELSVDLKTDGYERMVLRGNYDDKIEHSFNMTRRVSGILCTELDVNQALYIQKFLFKVDLN
jgi:hypothetical protein